MITQCANAVKILLVDDQISVRELLEAEIRGQPRCGELFSAADGTTALRLVERHRPEIMILGLSLPGMNGPELMLAAREVGRSTRFLIYTGNRNKELLIAGLRIMPHGFVHKTEPLATLRTAIAAVLDGNVFWGPWAAGLTVDSQKSGADEDQLPPKLKTVLKLIAEGSSTKQVAVRLSISPKTVEHYRLQIMRRLRLNDIASLTRYAIRRGIVE